MKLSATLLLFLFISMRAFAGFTFNDNCKKAYLEVMCLQFSAAEQRMQSELKLNSNNQVPYLIENYIDFLKVMIGEEKKDFDQLEAKRGFRLQHLAAAGKDSPWYLYSQSLVYLQSGMARTKFGEYVNASLEINRAYRLLVENKRKFPDFVMNKAALGILHSLIGTVPSRYKWAVRSLQFEGTISGGYSEITEAYQQIAADPQLVFLLPETAFLLSFVTLNLSADVPAALNMAEKMQASALAPVVKESPLLIYILANIYSKAGENDKVIKLLTERPNTADRYPFYYLDYMLGVAKLNRLDKDAFYPLLSFLGNFKGLNYIKSAYMHLAWFYLVENKPQQYTMYIDRIKLRGNDQVDNDREAMVFAGRKTKPNLALLKSRLLFDGGYYARAKHELDGFGATDKKEELEYTYRLGRIYHNWGKTDNAIQYYSETIKNGEKSPYYFAANAALQLGLIYEHRKDFELARQYFSKVLDMDFDEYQFSISNKAQAGLNRIKGK